MTASQNWRSVKVAAVEGVLALLETANTISPAPDVIQSYGTGYSTWLIDPHAIGTFPLTAEQIVDRIEARERATEA